MVKSEGSVESFWCSKEFVRRHVRYDESPLYTLLDIETCSVTVTKAYILLLAFCKALIMYIECYSLLPIVIPSSLLHLLPYVLFSGLLMTFSILLTLVYGVFSSSKFANFIWSEGHVTLLLMKIRVEVFQLCNA